MLLIFLVLVLLDSRHLFEDESLFIFKHPSETFSVFSFLDFSDCWIVSVFVGVTISEAVFCGNVADDKPETEAGVFFFSSFLKNYK